MYSESDTSHLPRYPYPGLRPFAANEDSIFFGRDELIGQLLRKVRDNRFVCVTGRSGCGKSSLVRTGMINKLHEGLLYGAGPNWVVLEMRPGGDPLGRLAKSLQESQIVFSDDLENMETKASVARLKKTLSRSPRSLSKLIAKAKFRDNTDSLATTPSSEAMNLLLLVDQFEEIFRYRKEGSIDHAERFVSLLLESARSPQVRINVVLTMRSDFIGDCALFHELPEALNEAQFLVRPLSRVERKMAIEEPAQLYGAEVEPGLTNLILNDMEQLRFKEERTAQDGPIADQLPLMQHALLRTWQRALEIRRESQSEKPSQRKHDASPKAQSSEKIILTAEMYEQVGGVQRALHRHAEEAYKELKDRKDKTAKIAKVMFRLLTQRTEGKQDIRRPTKISVVMAVTGASENEVKEVVKTFRRPDRSFIIPMIPPAEIDKHAGEKFVDSAKDLKPETFLDISHEALIRQWDTLNQWVKDEKDQIELYRRIEDDALRYRRIEEDDAISGIKKIFKKPYLARYQLEQATKWQAERSHNEAWIQHNFKMKGGEEQIQKNYGMVTRFINVSRARNIAIYAIASFIGLVALISVPYYFWEEEKQEIEKVAVESALRRSENDKIIDRAKKLPSEKRKLKYLLGVEVVSEGREIKDEANALLYLSDLLKESLSLNTIHAFSSPIEGPLPSFMHISASPDGKIIASSDLDGVTLWDTSKGTQISKIPQLSPPMPKFGPEFLPNTIISTSGDYLVTGNEFTGNASQFLLFDIRKPDEPQKLGGPIIKDIGHFEPVRSMAFSPDGKIMATASQDTQVILWDMKGKNAIHRLIGHSELARCVAFSNNGNILASGSYDKSIILWDVETGKQLLKLDKEGHIGQLRSLSFSPDDRLLASAGADDKIILWDVSDTPSVKKIFELTDHKDDVRDVVFHPKKQNLLVSCSDDKTIIIWDVKDPANPKNLKQIRNSDTELISLDFSPDGRFLISGDRKGFISLYTFNKDEFNLSDIKTTKRQEIIWDVEFAEDSQTIIIASGDGTIMVWNVRNNQNKYILELKDEHKFEQRLYAMALSPDGKWMATGGKKMINVSARSNLDDDPVMIKMFKAFQNHLRFAISPNSKWIAVGTEDAKILLFDAKERIGTLLYDDNLRSKYIKPILNLSFNQDGTIIAANLRRQEIIFIKVKERDNLDHNIVSTNDVVSRFIFSQSGEDLIVLGYKTGKIALWRRCSTDDCLYYDKENEQSLGDHNSEITSLTLSSDGQQLASCSKDGTIKIWNITENKLASKLSYNYSTPISDLVFINPNTLATADTGGRILFWDLNYGVPSGMQIADRNGSELHLSGTEETNDLLIYGKNYFQRSPATKILLPHEKLIDVAFTDNANVLLGGSQGEVTLWDIAKNEKTGNSLKFDDADLNTLAIMPGNPKLLVTGTERGHITIWNTESGKSIKELDTISPVKALAFNPAGDILAALIGPKTVKFWNVTGSELSELKDPFTCENEDCDIQKISFQVDENILAVGDTKGRLFFWDIESGTAIHTLETEIKPISDMAFSRNGKFLTVAGSRGQVKIWQKEGETWETAKEIGQANYHSSVNSVTFDPDSNILIAGQADGSISIWDLNNLDDDRTFHEHNILKINFDSEGKRLLIANKGGELTLLKGTALEAFLAQTSDRSNTADREQRIAISLDGKIEAFVESKKSDKIVIRNIKTKEHLSEKQIKPRVAAFSADGSTFILVDQDKKIFKWHEEKKEFGDIPIDPIKESVSHLAINHNGTKFAIGTTCGAVYLFHINEPSTGNEYIKQKRPEQCHQGRVSMLAFNDNGKLLATGGADGNINIWEIKNNEPLKLKKLIKGHKTPVLSLAFHPDINQIASLDDHKKLRLWIASSDDDKKLCLWDIETGKLTADLTGHQDNVSSLLFINQGKKLASASFDNTVKIWDLDIDSWLRQACEKAGDELSDNEKSEYLKSGYWKRQEYGCESYLIKNSN